MRLLLTLASLLLAVPLCGQVLLDSTTVHIDLVVDTSDGLNAPWDLEWGGDEHLWFTDATRIKRYDPATQQLRTVFEKDDYFGLGMVLHPDFPNVPDVYVLFDSSVYYSNGGVTHLYRYQFDSQSETLINEQMVHRYTHFGEHCGGRVIITQDMKLMITTSDYDYDYDSYHWGKIHRLNLDGSLPSDNPWPGDPGWTKGHRNPQGIVQLPNGRIYSSEHSQVGFRDELNKIERGANYGWPAYDASTCTNLYADSCTSPTFNFVMPLDTGFHPPSGVDWYASPAIPEFQNTLIMATLGWGTGIGGIRTFRFNAAGDQVTQKDAWFNLMPTHWGRVRDVAATPDGKLYMIVGDRQNLTWQGDTVWSEASIRVVYNPTFVGVESPQLSDAMHVRVGPNPFAGALQVQLEPAYFSTFEKAEFRLYSSDGKYVTTRWLTGPESQLSFNLPAGAYFYQVRTPNGKTLHHGKLIRQ